MIATEPSGINEADPEVTSLPSNCSGAIYGGVPSTVPSVVNTVVSVASDGPGFGIRFSQSKIQHLHGIACQDDVARFDIAVGDAGAMRAIRSAGRDLERLIEWYCALGDAIRQRLTLDQLHHHVTRANIKRRADVRTIVPCHRARFPFKARPQIPAPGDVFRRNLDGERAVKPRIGGFVHLAHSSCSDRGEDFVGAEFVADEKRHEYEQVYRGGSTKWISPGWHNWSNPWTRP